VYVPTTLAPPCVCRHFARGAAAWHFFLVSLASNMADGYGSTENGNTANAYADALARARQV